jgi:hypothetical protein
MKVIKEIKEDPMWDTVGQSSCDFRPTFDGDLVNLFTCVVPGQTVKETENTLSGCARQIAAWVLSHRSQFSLGDRFQIIIGWPESLAKFNRQAVKTGGDFEAVAGIANGTKDVLFMPEWSKQNFGE